MRVKTEARHLARQLRREGHSFADIRRVVPVANSTLNGWLKGIQLTDAQQQVILLKIYDARRRAQQLRCLAESSEKLDPHSPGDRAI